MSNKIDNLIHSVKKKYGWSDKQLAESLGVSSHSILSWKSGRRSPKRAIEIELEKLGDVGKGEEMQDKQYIIELQKEKIHNLEQQLEVTRKLPQYDVRGYEDADAILKCDIDIKWSTGINVRYRANEQDITRFAKTLGYSIEEMEDILSLDEMMDYKNHSIHKLRTEKDKAQVMGMVNSYLKVLTNIRFTTNSINVEVPIPYRSKSGDMHMAMNEYAIDWLNATGMCIVRFCK
jgi:transcriptional regulator with XRE-family HTH domain